MVRIMTRRRRREQGGYCAETIDDAGDDPSTAARLPCCRGRNEGADRVSRNRSQTPREARERANGLACSSVPSPSQKFGREETGPPMGPARREDTGSSPKPESRSSRCVRPRVGSSCLLTVRIVPPPVWTPLPIAPSRHRPTRRADTRRGLGDQASREARGSDEEEERMKKTARGAWQAGANDRQ